MPWHEAGRVDGDLLDTAVGMIRGNRSSHLLTFFDHDSQWRVLPLWNNGPPAVRLQREFSGAVYGDELWTLVQAGWGAGERFVRTASSCDGSSSEV